MMSVSEELILALHIGHSKSRNMGGRVRSIEVKAIRSCSYLVWTGVGRALLSSLLKAVTAAVINPLNGDLLLCLWPTAHLPTAPRTTFRSSHTSLDL